MGIFCLLIWVGFCLLVLVCLFGFFFFVKHSGDKVFPEWDAGAWIHRLLI